MNADWYDGWDFAPAVCEHCGAVIGKDERADDICDACLEAEEHPLITERDLENAGQMSFLESYRIAQGAR